MRLKKEILSFLMLPILFFSCGTDEEIAVEEIVILKSNIESLLVEKKLDNEIDGLLSITEEIKTLKELDLDGDENYIGDKRTTELSLLMEDLGYFSSLESLKLKDFIFRHGLFFHVYEECNLKNLSFTDCKFQEVEHRGRTLPASLAFESTKLHSLSLSDCSIGHIYVDDNEELSELNLTVDTRTIRIYNNEKLSKASFVCGNDLEVLSINNTKLETLTLKINYPWSSAWSSADRLVRIEDNPELKNIYFADCNINSVNLENNEKLAVLELQKNKINGLDLSQCKALENLNLSENKLNSIKLSENKNLKSLDLSHNKIKSIDLSQQSLNRLNLASNDLTQIDLANKKSLRTLDLSDNYLSDLSFDTMNLNSLNLSDNLFQNLRLPGISFSGYDNLDLNFSDNKSLSSIQYNGSIENLWKLNITNTKLGKMLAYIPEMTQLKDLDADNCNANIDRLEFRSQILKEISVNDNSIKELKFNDCPELVRIEAKNNPIAIVDINNSFKLESFNIPYSNSIWHHELLEICKENNLAKSESEKEKIMEDDEIEQDKDKDEDKDNGWNWTIILLVIIAIGVWVKLSNV